jgi:site-specific recombinase XerC
MRKYGAKAVRRLAHEAADSGLLSPELAAGIGRVKGVKQLGFRSGNWLTADECSKILTQTNGDPLRAKRHHAMLAMLMGCGLRRSEMVALELVDIQMRQGYWAIVDLVGKGGHIRTVPIPSWVKKAIDEWILSAGITEGRIFRAVGRTGKVWGAVSLRMSFGMRSKIVARAQGWTTLHHMISGGPAPSCVTAAAVSWSRFSFYWGMRLC